jgi:hypothetical protein
MNTLEECLESVLSPKWTLREAEEAIVPPGAPESKAPADPGIPGATAGSNKRIEHNLSVMFNYILSTCDKLLNSDNMIAKHRAVSTYVRLNGELQDMMDALNHPTDKL